MIVGVIGCGNVGFHTLMAFREKGLTVVGYDTDEAARTRVMAAVGSGGVATSYDLLAACDVLFECIPTDSLPGSGECDLSILENVVREISRIERLPDYQCQLFVQRSTCPPGTAAAMSTRLKRTAYAVNPSFIRKGTEWVDSIAPERIAFAGNPSSIQRLRDLYRCFEAPLFVSEMYEVVELLKYIENVTDVVLISLWNEFLSIADDLRIARSEFAALWDAFGERPKFRTALRVPGLACGLHCLPKDIAAILHKFQRLGLHVIEGALETNQRIEHSSGINSHTGTTLFEMRDGQLRLTAIGRDYLLRAGIE